MFKKCPLDQNVYCTNRCCEKCPIYNKYHHEKPQDEIIEVTENPSFMDKLLPTVINYLKRLNDRVLHKVIAYLIQVSDNIENL